MVMAVRMENTGGPEVLQYRDVDLPDPGAGEVRVRHRAIGLNYIDTYHRTGLYPVSLPTGLGLEAAGVVEAVGPEVENFCSGDRVAYTGARIGAYSEAINQPAERLIPLPDDVDFDMAAAALLKGMTAAYLLLKTYRVQAGQSILVHAAAGGTGLLLAQWAKALGARVIGTVGNKEKAGLARRLGCAETILYRQEDVASRVRDLTNGAGVPVVYDSVGAATCQASLDSLAPLGMFVSFGNASGPVEKIIPQELALRGSLYFTRPILASHCSTRASMMELAVAFFDILRTGAIEIFVGQRFPLREVRRAHAALEARTTMGASLLVP